MSKISIIFIYFFNLLMNTSFSQNKRDLFIADSIIPKAKGWNRVDKKTFEKLIKNIEQLEKDYNTYEAEMRYRILESAYNIGEIDFFKNQLSICVEKYGVQIPYMSEKESYYSVIMNGDLAEWFKKMYLEKHMIWLKNNFDKQVDLKKLNELHHNDQLLNSFSIRLGNELKYDSIQKKKSRSLFSEYAMKNLSNLYVVTQKNKAYPTAKTFAIVQNPFSIVELHNSQLKDNFERYYILFFDYYKKAYLDNDLYYSYFDEIDFHSYIHYGCTIFKKIYKKDINEVWWTNKNPNEDIPIKDIDFSNKIKKEFKW
jgi:hypothetical protein